MLLNLVRTWIFYTFSPLFVKQHIFLLIKKRITVSEAYRYLLKTAGDLITNVNLGGTPVKFAVMEMRIHRKQK